MLFLCHTAFLPIHPLSAQTPVYESNKRFCSLPEALNRRGPLTAGSSHEAKTAGGPLAAGGPCRTTLHNGSTDSYAVVL